MSLSPFFIKNVVYPLIERKNKSNTLSFLREYEDSQYLSRDEIQSIQWSRLKELLEYSYTNNSFYAKNFNDHGIVPSDIKSPSDFLSVPIVSKEMLQNNYLEMITIGFALDDLIEDYTGGSTGKPLKFYYDEERSQRREASRIRHNRWCGWDIGEKMAVLWGASEEAKIQRSFKRKLKNFVFNKTAFLDSFDLSIEKMNEFKRFLESYKPKSILAYANSIYIFALFLKDKTHNILPKGIISSAETLTEDKRELIESVFKCKVFNRYGSREIGLLASECEKHSGLHINAENVYVEIVNGNRLAKDNEMGEVIVTDLFNYAMPFIRYKIGDIAIASSEVCSCGRGLPIIKSVEGRVSDFITTSSGKIVHGEYFTHLFYGEEGVEEIQLLQERLDKICLRIVPSKKYSGERILNIK